MPIPIVVGDSGEWSRQDSGATPMGLLPKYCWEYYTIYLVIWYKEAGYHHWHATADTEATGI